MCCTNQRAPHAGVCLAVPLWAVLTCLLFSTLIFNSLFIICSCLQNVSWFYYEFTLKLISFKCTNGHFSYKTDYYCHNYFSFFLHKSPCWAALCMVKVVGSLTTRQLKRQPVWYFNTSLWWLPPKTTFLPVVLGTVITARNVSSSLVCVPVYHNFQWLFQISECVELPSSDINTITNPKETPVKIRKMETTNSSGMLICIRHSVYSKWLGTPVPKIGT